VERNPILPQELPEDAGMARVHVLKDQNAWHAHRAPVSSVTRESAVPAQQDPSDSAGRR
jgi:hypothetical protein